MIPFVPEFSTIRSLLSVWVRCGELWSFSDSTSRKIGTRSDGDHSLGMHAEELSARVFGGYISASALVTKHSHVPLFSSCLSTDLEERWHGQLVKQRNGADPFAASIRQHQVLEAPTMRRCPSCIREDVARYGFAHWRVFHQWPFARHCAVHGDALHTRCGTCFTSLERRPIDQLPDDPCHVCGSFHSSGPIYEGTEAYWSLLNLLYRGLRGEAPALRPSVLAGDVGSRSAPWGLLPLEIKRLLEAFDVDEFSGLAVRLGLKHCSDGRRGAATIWRRPALLSAALISTQALERSCETGS